MPDLSEDIALKLDHPISMDEFLAALKIMKMGKAPGPNGYTLCYYKTFSDILVPCFVSAFNFALPDLTLQAHSTVIPKEGKDTSQPVVPVIALYRS